MNAENKSSAAGGMIVSVDQLVPGRTYLLHQEDKSCGEDSTDHPMVVKILPTSGNKTVPYMWRDIQVEPHVEALQVEEGKLSGGYWLEQSKID